MGLVEIRISAAISWAVLIDAATVIFEKRAGPRACLPGIFAQGLRPLQIFLDELPAPYSQAPRQPVDLLFAERWRHFAAAVGAGCAVNYGPHPLRGLKNEVVDFLWLQIALPLQELAEVPVLIFLFLGQLTNLNKIEVHTR